MLPKIMVLSILMVFGTALWINKCNPYGSPILVMERGKISGVVNCETPPEIFQKTCNSYFCQKALFDRDLIRPYKDVYIYKVLDNKNEYSDANIHYLETKSGSEYHYYMCEVKDNKIVMMEEIDAGIIKKLGAFE